MVIVAVALSIPPYWPVVVMEPILTKEEGLYIDKIVMFIVWPEV